jgi:hypothetical protein
MPSGPVVIVRCWLVPILVVVTVTFASEAPDESVTVPVSAPVPDDWATATAAESSNAAKHAKNAHANFFPVNCSFIPASPLLSNQSGAFVPLGQRSC